MIQIKFNIFSIITAIGIFLLFFLITILLKRQSNRKANVILSLLLLTIAFFIFDIGLLYSTNLYYFLPHLTLLSYVWSFLFGPLFLFYIRALTKSEFRFHKLQFLHFLPLLIYIIIQLPFYLQSGYYKINYINKWMDGTIEPGERLRIFRINAFVFLQFWVCFFYSRHIVWKYQQRIKDNFSSIDKLNLSWVRWIVIVFFISSIINVFLLILYKFDTNLFYHFVPVNVTFFSCLLAYKGLTQPEIIFIKEEAPNVNAKKYSTYNLQLDDMAGYYSSLLDIMKQKKLYKNPNLSILDLSKELDIPKTYVSAILNEYASINFYDFINKFRVEEAKNIMSDPKNKNMAVIHIAFASGFNSKSSFNNYFKKLNHMTPTEFMKQCRISPYQ